MVMAPLDKPNASDYRRGAHTKFVLGADLGQSIDPTALVVIERCVEETGETKLVPGSHPLATNAVPELKVSYRLRAAELLPLGLNYNVVTAHIAGRIARTQEHGPVEFVFDEGGARGTGDMLRAAIARPRPIGVTLTGSEFDHQTGSYTWTISKPNLVTRLLSALEARQLEIAGDITHMKDFTAHLVDLRRKISALGHFTFNAREGAHDDFVTAAGLAWIFAARQQFEARMTKLAGF